MKTSFVLPMKFRLVDLLRSWLLSGLSLVARCGFLLALVTEFTAQHISAAEATNSALSLHTLSTPAKASATNVASNPDVLGAERLFKPNDARSTQKTFRH